MLRPLQSDRSTSGKRPGRIAGARKRSTAKTTNASKTTKDTDTNKDKRRDSTDSHIISPSVYAKLHFDEAECHLKSTHHGQALKSYNQALELNPGDKDALVARSQCYILLGEPQKALDDAETALKIDKNFVTALYQKAESLYFLGRFEHSLMYYHRGLRIRPELHKFRLGVQKAQEAIENMIGSSVKLGACLNGSKDVRRPKSDAQNTDKVKVDVNKNSLKPIEESVKRNNFLPKTPTIKQSQKNDDMKSNKKVKNKKSMGALDIDKEYFEKLIHHPDIKCLDKENTVIVEKAKEAVNYLNNRKEFWRQQLPTANNTTRKNGSSIISHR